MFSAAGIIGSAMTNAAGAVLVLLATALTVPVGHAVEDTWDYSVQVDSVVEVSPPKITLSWPQDTNGLPASYTVYRKAPAATSWGSGTPLPGSVTNYVDARVTSGQAYEYRIVKAATSYTGYGYIQAGIDVPLVEDRGTVVLVVDRTFATSLAGELARLQQDLIGDGWTVLRHDVGRTDPVVSVKDVIRADYEADPGRVKAVFLFGHVPVPYSGELNPDKHPDHVGAWPADVYYGDMHGIWTDRSVDFHQTLNTDPAAAARLTNIPGDGKFDQSTIPGAVELEVGRVDLANLPGRPSESGTSTLPAEQELLRQYLDRDHNFRHRLLNVQRRAIVGDYFGVRGGEAFAASGYRSFAPLVGAENIVKLSRTANGAPARWDSPPAAQGFLLAYDCGPGSYRSIDGLGQTDSSRDGHAVDRIGRNLPAVFTLIFGSWFGDWDNEDNLMRSILAAPMYGLAAAWSGRPHWFVHPMGLGETIGYTARLTQNNTGIYENEINLSTHLVHIALMGDPTLRLHPVAPGGDLNGAYTTAGATLVWAPSPDRVIGYHVYRATTAHAKFARLTKAPTPNPWFADSDPVPGATYMVRAVKLENTPSGSYYNASQGMFWTAGDRPARASQSIAASPPATSAVQSGTPRASEVFPHPAPPSGASL